MHHFQDIIQIFNACFSSTYNTKLFKGEDEPLYLPANEKCDYNALFFAHGFFSSALHECSHWLIAGEERRKQVDFGYWYVPDGRSVEQQELFLSVEVKPQAMEWILSQATGHQFRVSIDNLNGMETDAHAFKLSVYQQVNKYCTEGLSTRASLFRDALCRFYGTASTLSVNNFNLAALD